MLQLLFWEPHSHVEFLSGLFDSLARRLMAKCVAGEKEANVAGWVLQQSISVKYLQFCNELGDWVGKVLAMGSLIESAANRDGHARIEVGRCSQPE